MIKVINIAMGFVIVALVVVAGTLAYFYMRPGSDASGKLEYDLKQWQDKVNETPDDPLPRANLGVVYMDMGDTESAIRELKTAVELAPTGYTYMYKLGMAYKQAGDTTAAVDMLKQAMELYPVGEKYVVSYQIAQIYWEQDDPAAAKDFIQQSITDNTDVWNSHYLFGQILEKEGDLAKAREEYQAAAVYNPKDEELKQAINRVST